MNPRQASTRFFIRYVDEADIGAEVTSRAKYCKPSRGCFNCEHVYDATDYPEGESVYCSFGVDDAPLYYFKDGYYDFWTPRRVHPFGVCERWAKVNP